eukprot:scaffold6724_cov104-Isochrysis_galbana.AAC.7
MSGAVSIMRVSASATTRKARGEKGHPCGTPHLIVNGLLYCPAILTRRVGGLFISLHTRTLAQRFAYASPFACRPPAPAHTLTNNLSLSSERGSSRALRWLPRSAASASCRLSSKPSRAAGSHNWITAQPGSSAASSSLPHPIAESPVSLSHSLRRLVTCPKCTANASAASSVSALPPSPSSSSPQLLSALASARTTVISAPVWSSHKRRSPTAPLSAPATAAAPSGVKDAQARAAATRHGASKGDAALVAQLAPTQLQDGQLRLTAAEGLGQRSAACRSDGIAA